MDLQHFHLLFTGVRTMRAVPWNYLSKSSSNSTPRWGYIHLDLCLWMSSHNKLLHQMRWTPAVAMAHYRFTIGSEKTHINTEDCLSVHLQKKKILAWTSTEVVEELFWIRHITLKFRHRCWQPCRTIWHRAARMNLLWEMWAHCTFNAWCFQIHVIQWYKLCYKLKNRSNFWRLMF